MRAPWRMGGYRHARLLHPDDTNALAQVLDLCHRHRFEATSIRSHLTPLGAPKSHLGSLWLSVSDTREEIRGVVWIGANIMLLGELGDLDVWRKVIARHGTRASSVAGPAHLVNALWPRIAYCFPPPRSVRNDQPLLTCTRPRIPGDSAVRFATVQDTDEVLPQALAMYKEEMGYDPRRFGASYERHIASLVAQGRVFVWRDPKVEGNPIKFTANIGALAGGVAEIHGVWVPPQYRNQGIASRAMASVVMLIERHFGAEASLYVNAYNAAAVACYRNVGFTQHSTFATVVL